MFSRISKCHENSDGMHAKMGHQEANFKREGDTQYSSSIFCHRQRTCQENSSLALADMGDRNKPHTTIFLIS
jgi:hypothetical protein